MKSFKKAALASALVLFIAACGNEQKTENTVSETQTTTAPAAQTATPAAATEMTVKHVSGETTVKLNPQRIIAFDFGSLDTLEALDVDVIGIPKANIPSYLSEYKDDKYVNFGSLKEPDFEAIYAAKPDLIIVSDRQESIYDQFSEIAPTINLNINVNNYLTSLDSHVDTLGKLFGKEDEAQAQLKALQENIDAVKAKTAETTDTALILLANDGKVSAYGPGSRYGFIHDTLGFKPADDSIQVSRHGQNVTFEYVMNLNPDYIFVIDRSAVVSTGTGETSAKQLVENDLVKNTKAFQNGKIVYLDPNVWYLSGGGLKSTQIMVDDISKALEQ